MQDYLSWYTFPLKEIETGKILRVETHLPKFLLKRLNFPFNRAEGCIFPKQMIFWTAEIELSWMSGKIYLAPAFALCLKETQHFE